MKNTTKLPDEETAYGSTTYTGCCRFCGQLKSIESHTPMSEKQVDEEVTRTCDCDAVLEYAEMLDIRDRCILSIDTALADDSSAIRDSLHKFAEPLAKELIQSISLVTNKGISIKLKRKAKSVAVERRETHVYASEE